MNYLVVIGFVAIIASLGAAMIFMIKGDRDQPEGAPRARNMARALAFRVGFSIVLFLCRPLISAQPQKKGAFRRLFCSEPENGHYIQ